MSTHSLKTWWCVSFSTGNSGEGAVQRRLSDKMQRSVFLFNGVIMPIFARPPRSRSEKSRTTPLPSPLTRRLPASWVRASAIVSPAVLFFRLYVRKVTRDERENPLPLLNGQQGGVPPRPSTTAGALGRSSANTGSHTMELRGGGRIFTPPR